MDLLRQVFDTLLHLSPDSMNQLAHAVGPWLYVVLFAIIFAETGLVVVPFLPGDSLLFAVGAVAANDGSPVNLWMTGGLLIVAAVVGDAVNYAVGYRLGPVVFSREDSWWLNKKHLYEAQAFYEKYGGKTIILARFVPIVRTFAPFVAGIGRMNYFRFALFNVVGGVAWVSICLLAGLVFGGFEFVQKRFELVIVAIILISVLPMVIEFVRKRPSREGNGGGPGHEPVPAPHAVEPLGVSPAGEENAAV
jgi:membrane-associated protein